MGYIAAVVGVPSSPEPDYSNLLSSPFSLTAVADPVGNPRPSQFRRLLALIAMLTATMAIKVLTAIR